MSALFSDRHRPLKALAGVALVVGLGLWYGDTVRYRLSGWEQCIQDPDGHDGQEVVFSTYMVTAVGGASRYEIGGMVWGVPVEGASSGLSVGDRISVRGRFRGSDQVVVEEERLLHRLWYWKQGLGILGVILALLAAPLCFTIRGGRVVERG